MSRRGSSSSLPMRHPPLPDAIGEYPLGKYMGLPLIICDVCGQQRVLELVTKTDENRNKGRIFFKCPRNMIGVPARYGSCSFYEWQRDYMAKLVHMGKIVMVLGEEERPGIDDVADSKPVVVVQKMDVVVQKNAIEMKMDALVGALKALSFVMGASVLVGAMYVMK